MDNETKIIGRCPVCGGNVVKTCKGYRCENNTGEDGKCGLFINGVIGNRKMSDDEIAKLLEKRSILLDGFATKEWKAFQRCLSWVTTGLYQWSLLWRVAPGAAERSVSEQRRSTAPTTVRRGIPAIS